MTNAPFVTCEAGLVTQCLPIMNFMTILVKEATIYVFMHVYVMTVNWITKLISQNVIVFMSQ